MAVGVVHTLEIVHVDQDQRHVLLVRALHQQIVGAAVEQPRQRVVGRLVAELFAHDPVFLQDAVVDARDKAELLDAGRRDLLLLLHLQDHPCQRLADHRGDERDDPQHDQEEDDRHGRLDPDEERQSGRGLLQVLARREDQRLRAEIHILADAILVVHVIVVKDERLGHVLELGARHGALGVRERDRRDLRRNAGKIVMLGLEHQPHGSVLDHDQLV